MPERDDLDLLIDSALRDYAEPRARLEQRMLARLSEQARKPSRRRWILAAIAAPGFVAMLLLGYLLPKPPNPQPGKMAYSPAIPPVAPAITAPAPRASEKAALIDPPRHREPIGKRAADSAISRPKLDMFPTPQPLTAGEQAMIHFVSEAPESERKALIEAQQRIEEPLTISGMHIPPLQITDDTQH